MGASPDSSSSQSGSGARTTRRNPWEWVVILLGIATVVFIASLIWIVGGFKPGAQRHTAGSTVQTKATPAQGVAASRGTNTPPIHREAAPVVARRIVQRVMAYGSGPGEIGMRRVPGETPVGPESYAIGPDGNILIADLVNQRIVVCSPDGSYLREVEVPGVTLNDLAVDTNGTVILYDQREHRLYAGDTAAGFTNSLTLNPREIDTRGHFHVVGDAVYFADAATRDVLVAKLAGTELHNPEPAAQRRFTGIHSADGALYEVSIKRGESVQVRIADPAQSTSRELELPLTDVVAARFIGSDRAGRFFLSTERLESGGVSLELIGVGADGAPVERTGLPDNDYAVWTAKLIESSPDGRIVQFVPGEENAKLNLLYAP